MEIFGERLMLALKLRNKRPIDMANDLNINKGNLSRYINGKLPMPSIKIVIKWADYLNVAPTYLMGLTNDLYIPTIKPNNSLTENKEMKIKQALLSELNEILSKQEISKLRTILNIIKEITQ